MASFTLRAGVFGGAAGSSSVARVRGSALVVDLVRVRTEGEGEGCGDEEPDNLTLEDIVRSRAEGDFGTRRGEGEGVNTKEESVTRAPAG